MLQSTIPTRRSAVAAKRYHVRIFVPSLAELCQSRRGYTSPDLHMQTIWTKQARKKSERERTILTETYSMKDIINDNVQLFGSCHRVNPTSKHDRVDFGVLVSFFCRFLLLLLVLVSPNIMFCATLSCSSCRIHPRSAKTVTTCPKTNTPLLLMEMNVDSILSGIPFSLCLKSWQHHP